STVAALTPVELLALATDKDTAGRAALEAGDAVAAAVAFHQAEVCRAAAREMARLTVTSPDDYNKGMNQAQATLARRGRGVAKAAATNALLKAIAEDAQGPDGSARWGSGTVYAARRLRISQPAFSGYMSGRTPCPRHVDKKVREDFPGISWSWKKGVVD
ncbi:MAG: hypothetical protein M3Q00_01280, partial [Pseudomonadota bacterium]|nr:hypothetical protein [Pseudomonadota bacterium]